MTTGTDTHDIFSRLSELEKKSTAMSLSLDIHMAKEEQVSTTTQTKLTELVSDVKALSLSTEHLLELLTKGAGAFLVIKWLGSTILGCTTVYLMWRGLK